MSDHLVVVDGTNIVHRSFWATAQSGMTGADGRPSGALYGAINSLRNYARFLEPTHMLWCFDEGKSEFRTSLRPEYKGHRKTAALQETRAPAPEKDIPDAIFAFRLFLEMCDVRNVSQRGVEADDLVARAVHLWSAEMPITVISSDHDLLQLVRDDLRVRVFRPGEKPIRPATGFKALMDRGHGMTGRFYYEDDVVERYGVEPWKLPQVWALTGDSGDNIEGIAGVGPKTAAKWIVKHGSLAGVLRSEEKTRGHERKVAENFDLILLDGRIGDLAGPLSRYRMSKPDPNDIIPFLSRWNMKTLVEAVRMEGMW